MTRRILSVIIVVAMLFSFAVCAFAANENIRDQIVNETEFNISTYEGSKTVSMVVHIEDYPELAELDMIYDVATVLYEKQNELADDSFVLMSKTRITGELALHIMLFRVSYILGGTSESSPLYDYYLTSKDAEINIDEERIDESLINFIGTLVMVFNTLSLNSSSSSSSLISF